MKRKFLILTLCFTIIFSSINFKKSYADSGVISLPILATVSALAVGTGIVISGNNDLYDIGRIFYDYIDRHNDLTWATVQSVFSSSVSLQANKLVSVKSDFLDIVKGFFDSTFSSSTDISYSSSISIYPSFNIISIPNDLSNFTYSIGDLTIKFNYSKHYSNDLHHYNLILSAPNCFDSSATVLVKENSNLYIWGVSYGDSNIMSNHTRSPNSRYDYNSNIKLPSGYKLSESLSFPYNGSYTWDNVESKKENESVALPVPGYLGNLVGQNSTDFWDNTDNLVGTGNISIPNIDNPSISLDNTTSFPNTNVDTNNPSIPDVDSPTVDGIFPAFPSFGDSLDFSPMYLTNVTEKFPFSLPWDIGRLIQKFDVEPLAPVFEVPIVSETITLDLTEFSELASIVRFFVLIGFILALIFISTKLMA